MSSDGSLLAGLSFVAADGFLVKDGNTTAVASMLAEFKSPLASLALRKLEDAGATLAARVSADALSLGDSADFALFVPTVECPAPLPAASRDNFVFTPTAGTISAYGVVAASTSASPASIVAKDPVVIGRVVSIVSELPAWGADATTEEVTPTPIAEVALPVSTKYAMAAREIISSVEVASNFARYDGVRYGFRAKDAATLPDLYGKSRAESFSPAIIRAVMLGTLLASTGYYDRYCVPAQKVRTLIIEELVQTLKNHPIIEVSVESAEKSALLDAATLAGLPVLATPDGSVFIASRRGDVALLSLAQRVG